MVGNAAEEILRNAGITIGKKIVEARLKRIPADLLVKINHRVGFRLLTKFGEKGAVNLGKMIPLVGGVIGGLADGLTTHGMGTAAKKMFLSEKVAA